MGLERELKALLTTVIARPIWDPIRTGSLNPITSSSICNFMNHKKGTRRWKPNIMKIWIIFLFSHSSWRRESGQLLLERKKEYKEWISWRNNLQFERIFWDLLLAGNIGGWCNLIFQCLGSWVRFIFFFTSCDSGKKWLVPLLEAKWCSGALD